MVTVAEIYFSVTNTMLENGGFVLGIFSQAQFLDVLADVLLDFSQRAPLDKAVFTSMILAGVPEYIVPDDVMMPELCFVGGKLIEKTTETSLSQGHSDWRRRTGPPRQWREDGLPPKTISIFPSPDFNGAEITGAAPPVGTYGEFNPADRNLTMIGPSAPSKTAWAIGDTLDGIPDIFDHYLAYGILEQIFSSEAETRDVQRALYCHTRYEEGILLAQAISREELLDEEE